jgi:hypothetical protein
MAIVKWDPGAAVIVHGGRHSLTTGHPLYGRRIVATSAGTAQLPDTDPGGSQMGPERCIAASHRLKRAGGRKSGAR